MSRRLQIGEAPPKPEGRRWADYGLRVASIVALLVAAPLTPSAQQAPSVHLVDVTKQAGITFTHNNGAFGKKYLPETLGSGAAFLDYDNDGWQDVLLVNGTNWPGQPHATSRLALYRNRGNGTFDNVTAAAGLNVDLYGMGIAVADYDNDGFQDILITAVGQNHLFHNTGHGTFVDVTNQSGLGQRPGFSTSALWFDYDRDGLLDLLICNYVRWTPETDVYCSVDGKQKSYCTPEAYRGTTSWLFRNKGNGTFEDVTAKAGLFDTTSKSLGVTMIDYDLDPWPDVFIANDTQPNKLYRNNGNGTFTELGLQAGLAFSEDGRARAGMGADAADVDNSGHTTVVVTNFSGEMLGLYRPVGDGQYADAAPRTDVGRATQGTLGFGCFFFDVDLDGLLDLLVVNGHIDETISSISGRVSYAEPPHLFHNEGKGQFADIAKYRRRRVRAAEGRPRRGVRRLRQRRRPGRAHHDEQRTRVSLPRGLSRGRAFTPREAARHQVESRRHRGAGPRVRRHGQVLAQREDRLELSLPIRAARDLRTRWPRKSRPPRGRVAERRERRPDQPPGRPGLRDHRGPRGYGHPEASVKQA